jgi:hypothetical protein
MSSTPESGIDTSSSPAEKLPGQDRLTRDARAVANEAQNVAGEIRSEATAQVEQLAGQAKEQLSQATDKVRGLAADQKDLLAAQVGGVADAMERVANDLESNNGASARYARMIADNAEKLSSSIRDNSVDQLLGMAQDFGRRQPAAFIGAAALLGFAASRFLTASAQRPPAPPPEDATSDAQLPMAMSEVEPADFSTGRP